MIGPKQIIKHTCEDCECLHVTPYIEREEEWAESHCKHPSVGDKYISDELYTPEWCPVLMVN